MTTRSFQPQQYRRSPRAAIAAELSVAAGMCGLGFVLGTGLGSDPADPTQAVEVLAFAAAIAATILFSVAAWMSGSGRAGRITLAVGLFAVAYLSFRAVEVDAPLIRDVALIGVVAILASTLRRTDALPRGMRAALALACVVLTSFALLLLAPTAVMGTPVEYVVGVVTAAVAGTVAAGLVLAGLRRDKPLLRRVGVAFLLVVAGQSGVLVFDLEPAGAVLEFAAAAFLLVAAGHFTIDAIAAIWREHEDSQAMLAAAEAEAEVVRERDHEMRNLLLGLSGAATALSLSGSSSSDTGKLRAAARSEIDRLRQMLDDRPAGPKQPVVHVGPLLHDLATLRRAGGHDVRVDVEDGVYARMEAGALSQVVTNCLVNCARHAPGAVVRLRARVVRRQVVVIIADDGPGLPPGAPGDLLARGVRGPGSMGHGLGLHITADLVRRSGGTLRLQSNPGSGCTVVIEIPEADVSASSGEPEVV